jgi:hypothetical protein
MSAESQSGRSPLLDEPSAVLSINDQKVDVLRKKMREMRS